jgi:hypothetical protein
MSLTVGIISQRDLCENYGLKIKIELATKFAGLKITFPANLELLGIGFLKKYTIKDFSNLAEEDLTQMASMGITNEKIKQVAQLANYYAEKHYLGKNDNELESRLTDLSSQGIKFTVYASTSDRHQSKNLAFNHSWQQNSDRWNY